LISVTYKGLNLGAAIEAAHNFREQRLDGR